ncbi:hypothetical protein BGZ83_005461 [Gryganskiella cystojenkinii]|nr:hypothetical protein BGZ83_005461 [Gryganskiella cystojenkinii]
MSYNPVSTSDSRSNSPVPFSQQQQHQQQFRGSHPLSDHRSSEEIVKAPGSPYADLLDRSFATDQDFGSLPIAAAPSVSRHQQHVEQIPNRNPFEQQSLTSSSLVSSSTANLSSPPLPPQHQKSKLQARSILKNKQHQQQQYPGGYQSPPTHQQLQQQQPYYYQEPSAFDLNSQEHSLTAGFQPPVTQFAREANMMRPPNPQHQSRTGTASSVGSFEGGDSSSTHRSLSGHQLRPTGVVNNMDSNTAYNLTQSDMTLEGLTERWNAYQAWWAKQYKDLPFYRLWTRSKWILLFSVVLLMTYSAAAMAVSLGYILGRFENASVVMEFHSKLIYITLAGSAVGLATALVGLVGVFRENRIWLSWYSIMLWPVFALYLSVGYIAFRRAKNHLRNHLRDEWIHDYTREQRLLVQRSLKCCGYISPNSNGEYDLRCFPMINLPGCIHKYNLHEDKLLTTVWTASFSLVPLQLFVMIVALLCSNHVDGMLRSGRPGLKSFKEQ